MQKIAFDEIYKEQQSINTDKQANFTSPLKLILLKGTFREKKPET